MSWVKRFVNVVRERCVLVVSDLTVHGFFGILWTVSSVGPSW